MSANPNSSAAYKAQILEACDGVVAQVWGFSTLADLNQWERFSLGMATLDAVSALKRIEAIESGTFTLALRVVRGGFPAWGQWTMHATSNGRVTRDSVTEGTYEAPIKGQDVLNITETYLPCNADSVLYRVLHTAMQLAQHRDYLERSPKNTLENMMFSMRDEENRKLPRALQKAVVPVSYGGLNADGMEALRVAFETNKALIRAQEAAEAARRPRGASKAPPKPEPPTPKKKPGKKRPPRKPTDNSGDKQ